MDNVYLHNYMEDIVFAELENLFIQDKNICQCVKCKTDLAALVLNKLPPKYVVTEKGRIYAKLDELSDQPSVDVVKEITHALEKVKKNPRH